jgi:TP901 family phage tail tape measure protein
MGLGTSVATVFVDVEGDLTKFRDDVRGAGDVASRELGTSFGRAGKVAGTALAGGAAAALAGSATAFIDFERGMNEIFTLMPGESQAAYDEITAQTKGFAADMGVLPDQVIGGLYDALGAGVPKDNVFTFLETANRFAKAGNVDLTQSVDALTTGVNAFGLGAGGAERVADSMTKAVLLGKTTVEELSGSLYNVAPVAAAFGVSVEDVATGFAVLTAQGTPTAQAATQMKGAISELGKEGTKASDAFKEITGQSFTDFIAGGGNIVEAAGLMQGGADELGISLIDMFGSIEGGQAFLGLAADLDTSRDFLEQVQGSAGATTTAFEQMEQGIGPALDKTKARLAVAAIELGTALAPALETVGGFLADFTSLLAELPGPALAAIVGLVGLAGGLLILAGPILKAIQVVGLLSKAFTALALNPWTLLIIAAVAAVFLIVKYWDEIKAAIVAAWEWVAAKAAEIWNGITAFFSQWWPLLLAIFTGGIGLVVGLVVQNWDAIWLKTQEVWNAIYGFLSGVLSGISGFFSDYIIRPVESIIGFFSSLPEKASAAWNGVSGAISNVKGAILGALSEIRSAADRALGPLDEIIGKAGSIGGSIVGGVGKILGFDDGGVVPGPRGAPRLILAHAGETILPTHKDPMVGGGGIVVQGPLIGTANISNDLDIEHVARELDRRLNREHRAQGRIR